METTQTMPEASEAIKETFMDLGEISPARPILVGCGDDRKPTEESVVDMSQEGLPAERPYLKIFGGKYGAANVLLITTAAQHGIDFVRDHLDSDFFGTAEDLADRAAKLGVIMATHSSAAAEGSPAALNNKAKGALGCAKAAALGQINHLSAHDKLTIRVGGADSAGILASAHDDAKFQKLPATVKTVNEAFFGYRPDIFAVTRGEVKRSKTGVMILEGEHGDPEQTDHVSNLMPDKVSEPRELPYYDSDIVPVAEILERCYPELDLDPALMIQVMLLDAAATRTALAGGDPRRIKAVRYGDGQAALEYLSSL